MIIKNSKELATTALRRNALEIIEAGLEAIKTKKIISDSLVRVGDVLTIKTNKIDLGKYKNIFVVGIGKCAVDGCEEIEKILGDKLTGGIVVDVRKGELSKLDSHIGSHPLPTEENVKIATKIKKLLKKAGENDLILSVISGGGSSLLCLPHNTSCKKIAQTRKQLMERGATIEEINTINKHTSDIQGGNFAKLAYPARVISLLFSDVPGNDLSTIASGPTVKDNTTAEGAKKLAEKYGVDAITDTITETPKEDYYFKNVTNILLLSNKTALTAMEKIARNLGYKTKIADYKVEGEAKDIGAKMLENSEGGFCIFYAGETTVNVENGDGIGGRNQELALGALYSYLNKNLNGDMGIIVAVASDGWDNTDVAGALVDDEIVDLVKKKGIDTERYLAEHNSYEFFKLVSSGIVTGRTGSNVADLYFTLKK